MISDILPWDRKSYITHAILPWLSREATLEPNAYDQQVVYIYVKMTSSCEIASKLIHGLLEAYFKIKRGGEQEKESIIRVRVG